MDFDGLANSLTQQLSVVTEAPVPFAVAIVLSIAIIWKAFEWRYSAILDRQREHIAHLERLSVPREVQSVDGKPRPHAGREEVRLHENPERESKEREFVPETITPASLAKIIRGLNSIQAKRVTDQYIGKWITAQGYIYSSEVNARGEVFFYLVPHPDNALMTRIEESVSAYFPSDTEGLEVFEEGDSISLVGEIQSIRRKALILTKCELVA